MGVSVAAEEQRLEKEQTGRPYARAAAKPREDEFPDQRLNLEQQKSSREDGEREG
jgi:hypothetical protein